MAGESSTKVRNMIRRGIPDAKFSKFHNDKIEGGCSGFVTLPSGRMVNVFTNVGGYMTNTEGPTVVMFRVVTSDHDYTGERNRWCFFADLGAHLEAVDSGRPIA